MGTKVEYWIKEIFSFFGMNQTNVGLIEQMATFTFIIVLAIVVDYIFKYFITAIIKRGLNGLHTPDKLKPLIRKMFNRGVDVFIAIIVITILPTIFPKESATLVIISKSLSIFIVLISTNIVNTALKMGYEILKRKRTYRQKPIKGFLQILQIITYFITGIIVVSIFINKSPSGLLTGLGAFAAVISFIFKDSILGFISGVQLSANDMIRPGDWITVQDTLADGVVTDVTLITVKVQNFDNTVVTVPTYSLITNPVQNWRAMQESKGRRSLVSLFIDTDSIKVCTQEEVEKMKSIAGIQTESNGIVTNIELYRNYLMSYLKSNPKLSPELTTMVRYLESTPNGLPLQLYCFSKTKDWVEHEQVQSEITEHAIAMCTQFDLKIFQALANIQLKK